jgi:hypothetical protein
MGETFFSAVRLHVKRLHLVAVFGTSVFGTFIANYNFSNISLIMDIGGFCIIPFFPHFLFSVKKCSMAKSCPTNQKAPFGKTRTKWETDESIISIAI